jgi:tetratricopeptide (TPR) repeat protein
MKRLAPIAFLALASCMNGEQRTVERALRAGVAQYRAAEFDAAATTFADAPADVRLAYNAGNAHYRSGRYAEAITRFQEARDMTDSTTMKAGIWYNMGNAWSMQAKEADSLAKDYSARVKDMRIEGDDIVEKVSRYVLRDSLRREGRRLDQLVDSALKEGAEAYRNALRHTPGDEDARHNLAAAQRLIAARPKPDGSNGDKGKDDKKPLGERAKLLLKQADELVEQNRFQEALVLLKNGLKEDPTLEQRKEYMDKLDVVTKAAETR